MPFLWQSKKRLTMGIYGPWWLKADALESCGILIMINVVWVHFPKGFFCVCPSVVYEIIYGRHWGIFLCLEGCLDKYNCIMGGRQRREEG